LASSGNQPPLQYLWLQPPNLRHHKSRQALIGSLLRGACSNNTKTQQNIKYLLGKDISNMVLHVQFRSYHSPPQLI